MEALVSTALSAPTAQSPHLEFSAVKVVHSGNLKLFSFSVSGEVLARFGRPIPLEDDPVHGVQRLSSRQQIRKMKESMREGIPFPDNIVANLGGDWIVDEADNRLVGDANSHRGDQLSFFEIVDGQNRMFALKELIEGGETAVAARYEFTVVASLNADDKTRRMLFLVQTMRKPVERTHALALTAANKAFRTDTERFAWELVLALSVREDSVLNGKIFFNQRHGANGRARVPDGMLPVTALYQYARGITSKAGDNALKRLDQEQRLLATLNMFAATQKAFPTLFLIPEHTLGQPLGICAIMSLLSSDGELHVRLARLEPSDEIKAYSAANITRVLKQANKFRWTPRSDVKFRDMRSPGGIAERFNRFLRTHC